MAHWHRNPCFSSHLMHWAASVAVYSRENHKQLGKQEQMKLEKTEGIALTNGKQAQGQPKPPEEVYKDEASWL